jgi:Protein of unknown function DUF262
VRIKPFRLKSDPCLASFRRDLDWLASGYHPRALRPGRDVEEHQERRQTPQPIAWFRDLHTRGLLNLSPPYQRRSVWNQAYKDSFIETVLLNYPAPPLFLHETISADGVASYSVVDGKQRLSTVLDFADNLFAIPDKSALERLQGRFFSQFDDPTKTEFWKYKFTVEFLPVTEEGLLNEIFNRLNRNVARLTRQELRRAKFSGVFASTAEELSDFMLQELQDGFPRIAPASRRQMKDIELTAQLLLLVESGPSSFSQDELDQAYSDRDEEWEERQPVERQFRAVISYLNDVLVAGDRPLSTSRLRNQADFYSLFGATLDLRRAKALPPADVAAASLLRFVRRVANESKRAKSAGATEYYEAARSASNDARQRRARIRLITEALKPKS